MSWKLEVDEINRRKELAKKMGGAEAIERHQANGSRTD